MVYLRYEKSKRQFIQAQENFSKLLHDIETDLFTNKNPSKRGKEKIAIHQEVINNLSEIFLSLQEELYKSKEVEDKVYRFKYIEKLSVKAIALRINYSETQVFRILATIKEELNKITTD